MKNGFHVYLESSIMIIKKFLNKKASEKIILTGNNVVVYLTRISRKALQ